MDGFVTPTIARQVRQILTDRDLCEEIVNHNYEVAVNFIPTPRYAVTCVLS